jgi:hypothetical protein
VGRTGELSNLSLPASPFLPARWDISG